MKRAAQRDFLTTYPKKIKYSEPRTEFEIQHQIIVALNEEQNRQDMEDSEDESEDHVMNPRVCTSCYQPHFWGTLDICESCLNPKICSTEGCNNTVLSEDFTTCFDCSAKYGRRVSNREKKPLIFSDDSFEEFSDEDELFLAEEVSDIKVCSTGGCKNEVVESNYKTCIDCRETRRMKYTCKNKGGKKRGPKKQALLAAQNALDKKRDIEFSKILNTNVVETQPKVEPKILPKIEKKIEVTNFQKVEKPPSKKKIKEKFCSRSWCKNVVIQTQFRTCEACREKDRKYRETVKAQRNAAAQRDLYARKLCLQTGCRNYITNPNSDFCISCTRNQQQFRLRSQQQILENEREREKIREEFDNLLCAGQSATTKV